ncbi:hypothetical protein DFH11DRAFT_1581156 [Phellopilus nigrolimitatus]|nr:hypothetical protein DFH11DRAFT_1581156 [Phellopilus nigrolimitatus]
MMGDAVRPHRLGHRRFVSSRNSPDRKHQQSDARRVSMEVDAEISNFIRSIPGMKILAYAIKVKDEGTLSTRGALASMGPDVLSDLADFCEKYGFKNFNADLKHLEKCKTRLDQMAEQDVNELGRLFCVALILTMDGPKSPSERLFSVSAWEEVLNHAFFDAPSTTPTESR